MDHLAMNRIWLLFLTLGLPLMAGAESCCSGPADGLLNDDKIWAFKLTPSYYSTTHQQSAFDLNLRANQGPHAVWLGYYQRGQEFEQVRTGYELTLESDYGRLVPSLQLATHDFAGAAVNLELGRMVYALLGYGRTNAKDYYNLNFDPNDSVVYGLGTRLLPQTNLSVYTVKDNRLHTEQVVTHLVARIELHEGQRLTLDRFEKHGRETPDDLTVSGHGLALTYDFPQLFIRVARDRKVNFSNEDQNRIAFGVRF